MTQHSLPPQQTIANPIRGCFTCHLLTLIFLSFWLSSPLSSAHAKPPTRPPEKEELRIQGKTATQIIADVRKRLWDQSSVGEIEMTITRPSWKRALRMKIWGQGDEYSFVRILSPARERGVASLKRKEQMWNYMPRAEMVMQIPSSMMLSSWMGSDFTNDDLVRSSDLLRDYQARIRKIVTKDGVSQAELVLKPRPQAPVVWGKLVLWVRSADLQPLRQEYYNEEGKMMRVMEFEQHKIMGGRLFPTHLRMKDLNRPGHQTEMKYISISFNQTIPSQIFTLRHLKKKSW